MIQILLRGGLGNQMFQYALGLQLALRNQTPLVLDTAYLDDRWPRQEFTFRNYDLDIFQFLPRFTFLSHCSQNFPIPGFWLASDLFQSRLRTFAGYRWVREKAECVFDPSVLNCGPKAVLWGYWQREEYFYGIESQLRQSFQFCHPLAGPALQMQDSINACSQSVSLHVRRGDHIQHSKVLTQQGDTDLNYYSMAAKHFSARFTAPEFFIFSDDLDWCRQNLRLPGTMHFVDAECSGPKASYHMQLMAQCRHHIIAKSSFSWWAAWLNTYSEKIVIAPRLWYRDGKPDPVPPQWLRY